jgi:serine/threonine protein kinase
MKIKKSIMLEGLVMESGKVDIHDFNIHKVIGRGSFGKVYLVEMRKSGQFFAMKSIKKEVIIKAGMVAGIIGKPS